jgi:hypothetical protein
VPTGQGNPKFNVPLAEENRRIREQIMCGAKRSTRRFLNPRVRQNLYLVLLVNGQAWALGQQP